MTGTPQPPAPQAPTAAPAATPLAPHRGTMILVFGIIGLVCCIIFGIIAWVMGNKDLKEMAAGRMDPTGLGTTKAGKICGMISVILAVVGLIVWIILMALGIGTLTFSSSFGS